MQRSRSGRLATQARCRAVARTASVCLDRLENRVARSPVVPCHQLQGERVFFIRTWWADYDEGSQNELMLGDVGDILVGGPAHDGFLNDRQDGSELPDG